MTIRIKQLSCSTKFCPSGCCALGEGENSASVFIPMDRSGQLQGKCLRLEFAACGAQTDKVLQNNWWFGHGRTHKLW
jgi:hypothetical protein